MPKHKFIIGYGIVSLMLLLYSYTQVDLNLTLSRSNLVQTIEKAFQYIGYYQRPISTLLYVVLTAVLFGLYAAVISAVKQQKLDGKGVWYLIGIVTVIVVFSYPAAFSYDFFNYMFTAKTVLVYHQNPYLVTPLQFAGLDPWTNFMRWTHLTTAYAPLWIGMTLVPYLFGLGYFVLILFNLKFLVAGWYVLAAWAIWRSAETINPKRSALSLAIFALNPLVIVESLVSGHNDIVLVASAMLSVWAYLNKKYWSAWWWLAVSIAAKTVTLVLIPVMFMKRNTRWMLGAMLLALGVVLVKREFLPWYWVWVMPFISLIPEESRLTRFGMIVSLGLLLSYAPYLYFGDYNATEQLWKTAIIWIGVGVGCGSLLVPLTGPQGRER